MACKTAGRWIDPAGLATFVGMSDLTEVSATDLPTRAAVFTIARTAWNDLTAHWRRPHPPGAPFWPLWLALTVLAFALLDGVSLAFDADEAHAAFQLNSHLVAIFQVVTKAGDSAWLFATSILTLLYALYRRSASTSRLAGARYGILASRAFYFFVVQAFSGLLSQLIKHLVGRARPRLIDELGPWHFDLFSIKAVLASFPSGHTISIFAAAASLAFFMPRHAAVLFALALPVAASRMIVGAHYPSDVLAGVFLGLGSALAVARFFARRKIAFTLKGDELLPEPRGKLLSGTVQA
jgi:membrane-associated phospholipid phosphatase